MKTFTVIGYVVRDGGHLITEVQADDATAAAVAIRDKLGSKQEFEVIGVVAGTIGFERLDERQVVLARYSPGDASVEGMSRRTNVAT